MTIDKEKFFKAVAEAYQTGAGELLPFPESYEQASEHENGDGLADFIRIELEEGINWEKDPNGNPVDEDEIRTQAIHLLENAIEDIGRVLLALEKGRELDFGEGDDLCDHCMRSGVQISHVDEDGKTICHDCMEVEDGNQPL